MNILFVHEVDWLKKVVFDVHSLSEGLSVLGHRVYAIDFEDTWQRQSTFSFGSLRTQRVKAVSRALAGASVCLHRPGFVRIPGLSRLSAGVTHRREIQKIIREKNIDVIVLYSVPTNGLQAVHLARKFGIPIVFRSIDMLYRLVRYPPLRPLTRLLEQRVYSQADAILAITPNHAQYVRRMGASEQRIKLLPLPIDTQIFRPSVDPSSVRKKWGLKEEEPVIVFIGTLFEFSGLDGFLHQFPRIAEAVPNVRLMIVGDGPQRPTLQRIIAKEGLKKQVIITGFEPYTMMPEYINLGTVCINPFINTPATRDIFPGKIIQYMACGKVTIATPLLGITSLLPSGHPGLIYSDNASDMADTALELLRSPEQRRKLEEGSLDYIMRVHDQSKVCRQLESILLETIQAKR